MSAGMFAGVNGAVRALTEGGGAAIGSMSQTGEIDFGFIPAAMFFQCWVGNPEGTVVFVPKRHDVSNQYVQIGDFDVHYTLTGTKFKFDSGLTGNISDFDLVVAIK